MLTSKKCFEGGSEHQIKKNIVEKRIPKIHIADESNPDLKDLKIIYEKCLEKNPENRPDITDIMMMPTF